MYGAALARCNPSYYVSAVFDHLAGMKSALLSGEALNKDAGILVY
jgi:hypothetical protein